MLDDGYDARDSSSITYERGAFGHGARRNVYALTQGCTRAMSSYNERHQILSGKSESSV